MKKVNMFLLFVLLLPGFSQSNKKENDLQLDGFVGRVKTVKIAVYDSKGSLEFTNIYKYDAKGNKVEEARYRRDGALSGKNIYKYDEKGNKVEEATYDSWDLTGKKIYKYDAKGNVTKAATYNSDGSLSITEITTYEYYK